MVSVGLNYQYDQPVMLTIEADYTGQSNAESRDQMETNMSLFTKTKLRPLWKDSNVCNLDGKTL